MSSSLKAFLEALGNLEEPMGMFYTDIEPESGFVPKEGASFSYEMEQAGELNGAALWENWSCVMGNVWIARKKKTAAYFEAKRFGCVGGSFWLGFHKPQLDLIAQFISTGIPGQLPGERYLPSPEVTRRYFNEVDPRPAPARFCVFKPISQFKENEAPEVVTFFARGEVLSGLCTLASFVTLDFEVVVSPSAAGCSAMVTWPLRYMGQGKTKAVLGGWDPSARKFMKTDEATFSIPYEMYLLFLEKWQDSFLVTETWEVVKKRIAKSHKAWGE